MVSAVPYGLLPDYYKQLGKDAEFVYSGSFWDAALPYPGNQEFVAVYAKEFSHPPAVQSAWHMRIEPATRTSGFAALTLFRRSEKSSELVR